MRFFVLGPFGFYGIALDSIEQMLIIKIRDLGNLDELDGAHLAFVTVHLQIGPFSNVWLQDQ